MDQNTQRTQELLAQEGLESIGQKLYNTINIELPGKPEAPRRWVWELLQNAKDVIASHGKIEITLSNDSVEFAHNGRPFIHDHLLALLSQRSTKSPSYTDDEKMKFFDTVFNDLEVSESAAKQFLNTSGRFGTGFMTTYLLSKKVFLQGLYSAGNGKIKSFKLSLDREADKPEIMKDKVVDSFSSFADLEKEDKPEDIVTNYKEGSECYTKFTYYFTPDAKKVAEQGILDLHNSIPFVFSFVDKIDEISVIEYGGRTIYSRHPSRPFGAITIDRIEKNAPDGDSLFEIAKLSSRFEALTIAIPIQEIAEKKYRMMLPNSHTPRQFISFPLVGSEAFSFPVIIHSPLFNPDDARSHVFLNLTSSEVFDKKVNLNRQLFQQAVILFKQLLKTVAEKEWDDLHYLAKTKLPIGIIGEWYRDSIQREMREELLDSAIVVTEKGQRIKPKGAKFPVCPVADKMEEFWRLCQYLYGDLIPRKEDVQLWKEIITADKMDWPDVDLDLDLPKLLLQIQQQGTFNAFQARYFKDGKSAFAALNEIIRFTEENDKDLLNRKEGALSILPNQTKEGVFAEKGKLRRDRDIPYEIKSVMESIGDHWFDKLVRNEIEVFESEKELTVKIASDHIRDKIDKYYADKLTEEEDALLENGLFELAGYSTNDNRATLAEVHAFLRQFFPDRVSEVNTVIAGTEDLDWMPVQTWAVKTVLAVVAGTKKLDNLSLLLFKIEYPGLKDHYSKEEDQQRFNVDTALNKLIQFVLQFDKTLLSKYAIIPNQLNEFCLFNNQLFNDQEIPKELKVILKDLGKDCRGSLMHEGVSVTLPGEPRDLKWICSQLDDMVIKESENSELKQPIRELDKWISKHKQAITATKMEELFKSFYRRRAGIVLNTYDLKERDQIDEILNSGMSGEFAEIVQSGATAATIKSVVDVIRSNPGLDVVKVNDIADLLKKRPGLTADKLEGLLELSEGWNPALNYSPEEAQKRTNLENGWLGEAFVYKTLYNKGLAVDWRNKSSIESKNFIIDNDGVKHFIQERFEKYDLVVNQSDGKKIYIQVKSTVTDLSNADQFAIPISLREWNFVFETSGNESFYLARVFNVKSAPVVYFMKLEKPEEF